MKSSIFTCFFCFVFSLHGFGQTKFGIRFSYGLCQSQAEDNYFVTADNRLDYKLSFQEQKNSLALGLFLQKRIGFIYLQPEILYRTSNSNFGIIDFKSKDYEPHLMPERFHYFHIPITAGILLSQEFRFGAGPVFNYLLDASSDLENMAKLTTKQRNLHYGFQIGLGFDYRILFFDLKYELAFSKVGDHIYYSNEHRAFSSNPNLLNLSIGLAF